MRNLRLLANLGLFLALLLSLGMSVFADHTDPYLNLEDQPITNGTIVVPQVAVSEPGFIDVHVDQGGHPGAAIGYVMVTPGHHENVVVPIDASRATRRLYVILHSTRVSAASYSTDVSAVVVVPNVQYSDSGVGKPHLAGDVLRIVTGSYNDSGVRAPRAAVVSYSDSGILAPRSQASSYYDSGVLAPRVEVLDYHDSGIWAPRADTSTTSLEFMV